MSNPVLTFRVTPIMMELLKEAAIRDRRKRQGRISVGAWCGLALWQALQSRPDFEELRKAVAEGFPNEKEADGTP